MAAGSLAWALVRARALHMQVVSATALVGHKQHCGDGIAGAQLLMHIIHLPLNLGLIDDVLGVLVRVTFLSLDAPEEPPRRLSTLERVGERVPKQRATQHRT